MKKTIFALIICLCCLNSVFAFKYSNTPAGMIYFASHGYVENNEVLNNPYIIGGLYTMHWSVIESEQGKYNWKEVDDFVNRWTKAGKKVALRIMWSSSGYWRNPVAGKPTPAWVWKAGAKYAYHKESNTELALFWDPIFREHAMNFMKAVNKHFKNNKEILFIDVTPGAETNPYRFGTINRKDPQFKESFSKVPASDGRTYTEDLWTETIKSWIKQTAKVMTDIPCLVTLNQGSLFGRNNFPVFGQTAVDNGMYVGQNGIHENSYQGNDALRTKLFNQWKNKTKLFFKMVHAAEPQNTGSMQGVIEAAKRIDCDYLNVYPQDVLKSTVGTSCYNTKWDEALKNGYNYFSSKAKDK